MLVLRFDLRNPAFAGVALADRYAAALDMCCWADDHGALAVVLSEHHGSDDGYLPSALTMAAAVAARTERVGIWVSAVAAPFHDPVRLAEEAIVVDALAPGRVTLVLANGYVPSEFEMFGVPMRERAARTEEAVRAVRAARSGAPVVVGDRSVRVTPVPDREHPRRGPTVLLGGSGPKAAKRAARIADGFQPSNAAAWEAYRDERLAVGKPDPGGYVPEPTGFTHVATDPDAVWPLVAPHAVHESSSYGRWAVEGGMDGSTGYRQESADELRASGRYRVVTPAALVGELRPDPGAVLLLHPMMGGLPPDLAWESLHLVADEVLPDL